MTRPPPAQSIKMFEIFVYYIQFGGVVFAAVFFAFISLYSLLKFFSVIFRFLIKGEDPNKNLRLFLEIFLIFLISIIFFTLAGIILDYVASNASAERISFFDNFFMQIDKTVFGVYLPFWFQDLNNHHKPVFDFFGLFIVKIYEILAFFLGILFVLLLLFKPNYFCKLSLSFGLTLLISPPLWFLFPAVSPLDAYINNVISTPIPTEIQATVSLYRPNKFVESFLESVKGIDNDINKDAKEGDGERFFAITTMPSMHIAWSLLILYFGIILWRPAAVFLIPYFLVNALSTVYLLQHYTIDIFGGLIVGVISIWLATIIVGDKIPKFILHISESFWLDFKTGFGFNKR